MLLTRHCLFHVACFLAATVSARPLAANADDRQLAAVDERSTIVGRTPSLAAAQAGTTTAGASGGGNTDVSQLRQAVLHANAQRKAATDKLVQAYNNAQRCWPILPCPATLQKWRLNWQKHTVADRFEATLRRLPRLSASPAMLAALNADVNRDSEVSRCMKLAFGEGSVRDNSLVSLSRLLKRTPPLSRLIDGEGQQSSDNFVHSVSCFCHTFCPATR
jgi:hypothetical protein